MQIIASDWHAYARMDFFSFSYFSRTIANWSASEAILSSISLESFKSNLSAFLNSHIVIVI